MITYTYKIVCRQGLKRLNRAFKGLLYNTPCKELGNIINSFF